MTFFDENLMYIEPLAKPKYLVFSDFDETYLAHNPSTEESQQLDALQAFLKEECNRRGILFGWVTGSPLNSVIQKMKKYKLSLVPGFIASAMGTRITHHSTQSPLTLHQDWPKTAHVKGFDEQVQTILSTLSRRHIALDSQAEEHNCEFKKSYYYRKQDDSTDEKNLFLVKKTAADCSLAVNVSLCNQQAGDPADCYDVDFIPRETGKTSVVNYFAEHYNLPNDRLVAFGDSGNDLSMLSRVGNGWLVGNAPDEIKGMHDKISNYRYAQAILNVLETLK